jgi:N-acyl-D-aspartate/D-glutamate deacylase
MDRTVDLALKEKFCMIGSDGGIEYAVNANSHPRGAGCFSTALRHGQDLGLPVEFMLEKMTSLPQRLLRPCMNDRGVLQPGAWADLTIFDPTTVNGTATVSNPNQFSRGIDYVFVNGKLAYRQGVLGEERGVGIKY